MLSLNRFPFRLVPAFLVWLCALGLVVRLTVKDTRLATSPIYYGMPPVVIGAVALLSGILWRRRGYRKFGRVLFALAVGCFVWQGAANARFGRDNATDGTTRVVFWNVARGALGYQGVFDELRELDADIIGIVEAGHDDKETLALWKDAFPDYSVSQSIWGTLLLCRGNISQEQNRVLGYHSLYKEVLVEAEAASMRIFIVDMCSAVVLDRKRPLDAIANVAKSADTEPVLIMGDFNTPADSVHFSALRKEHANAFEAAGVGYASTWPSPLACIQIDHAWTNRHIHVSRCRHGWSWHSDHRPIVMDLSVVEAR